MANEASRFTDEQTLTIIRLRQETNRGSDHIHSLIFKEPEKYGFDQSWIPSINAVQGVLKRAGLIKEQQKKSIGLMSFGMKTKLRTPLGILSVTVERVGVTVSDGTNSFTFFKEEDSNA